MTPPDVLAVGVPLVSSLKVTFDLKGLIVSFGSAFRNLIIAALGILGIECGSVFDALLDDRERLGVRAASASLETDADDDLRADESLLGNMEEKNPRVGSNGANLSLDSCLCNCNCDCC